jgi:Asp-tRNA(Asn)/Glu-tRNA(Gln) amidotransferase A subunit family amidase
MTLGAIAWGDVWFGGMTRNPWNPKRGSSGSSAGSASAVAAGCVAFAIGSETLGSIVSPSTECGVTGLRPTYGRVSRHGCMALSWSMDKLGPMARSVEDCALILGAIHGSDGKDASAVDRDFTWPCKKPLTAIRVGYTDGVGDSEELKILKDRGVKIEKIKLPTSFPLHAMDMVLSIEASAAFDELVRKDDLDGIGAKWPEPLRRARFVPAVDYLRAQRLRTLLMREMDKLMEGIDIYMSRDDLVITNLTGHPTICLPAGFRKAGDEPERPTSLTLTGRLYGESELLAVAKVYQDATAFHTKRPPLEK